MPNFTPEEIQKLDQKVWEVGTYLGLKFDEDYAKEHDRAWTYYGQLTGNNHLQLHFEYSSNRWKILGLFLNYKSQSTKPYGKNFIIGVDGEKTPKKIARDIQSRLMPRYLEALAEAEKTLEAIIKYHAGKLEAIRKVARFLGVPEPEEGKEMIYPPSDTLGMGVVGRIESYSEDLVKFDVKTTPEKCIKILQVLMEK